MNGSSRNFLHAFFRSESSGGLLLLVVVAIALSISNSAISPLYFHWLQYPLALEHDGSTLTVLQWINDGLMTFFFLGIGLEIKREITSHELRSLGILPFTMALGGIVVPALIFSLATSGTPYQKGWAIPTATDIAFTLGILSLLGKRIPSSLRLAVVSLAVIDDLGAVIIIALFFNEQLSFLYLSISLLILLLQLRLAKISTIPSLVIFLLGIVLWYTLLCSGIHPTLAGIITGLIVPITPAVKRFEFRLESIVNYAIVPLFAFANAGVVINSAALSSLFSNGVFAGLVLGLVIGKPLGIIIASRLTTAYSSSVFPKEITTKLLTGAAMLCGIGFTMSLFITSLAYGSAILITDTAKIGILCGSALSGIGGYWYLRSASN